MPVIKATFVKLILGIRRDAADSILTILTASVKESTTPILLELAQRQRFVIEPKTRDYVPGVGDAVEGFALGQATFFWLHIASPHNPSRNRSALFGHFRPHTLVADTSTSSAPFYFHLPLHVECAKALERRSDEAILMADDVIG